MPRDYDTHKDGVDYRVGIDYTVTCYRNAEMLDAPPDMVTAYLERAAVAATHAQSLFAVLALVASGEQQTGLDWTTLENFCDLGTLIMDEVYSNVREAGDEWPTGAETHDARAGEAPHERRRA